ncbi:helix-turn-helix domain-containing protein [Marinobacter xestospongiae]|uniref:Helix-turn-helix transcriptional regulator n=1 Tax=Marinobacter xestospongiae TaxID=994319 RepID=A0ABU3VUE9_9GAMM|nr:helix-turn-helix transcriptional regulator [Marinobacter xestospongiae]MDV2077894.1 helix-turn-helix transcriptional regulator [Marinobacter xestospongiae]
MAQTIAIVDALKRALKEHGLTYQQVAEALSLSEASVKRLFSERQFSLKRLDQVCGLMGLEISDLVRRLEPEPRIDQLTTEQEKELVSDNALLLIAICALNRWTLPQILENYTLDEPTIIRCLARLDRMGLVELLPGNRIKALISHDFHWLRNGPIQTFFESQVQADFFECRFNRPGELRLFLNGMLSTRNNDVMQQKLRRLALDFRHCHQEDLALPLDQRFGMSMMLAIRPWEVAVFRQFRRPHTQKVYPGHPPAR